MQLYYTCVGVLLMTVYLIEQLEIKKNTKHIQIRKRLIGELCVSYLWRGF